MFKNLLFLFGFISTLFYTNHMLCMENRLNEALALSAQQSCQLLHILIAQNSHTAFPQTTVAKYNSLHNKLKKLHQQLKHPSLNEYTQQQVLLDITAKNLEISKLILTPKP